MFQELNELRQSELIDGWFGKKRNRTKTVPISPRDLFLGALSWLKLVDKREILFFISTAGAL